MRHITVFILFICVTTLSNAQDNSQCSDILKDGIRDTYNFSYSEDFDSQFDSWIDSQQFNNYVRNSKNGFNLTLPIPKFPISLGSSSSNDNINEFKRHYKSGLNIENKRIVRQNLMHAIANSEIIDAWSTCMEKKNNSPGLQSFIEDDRNSLLVNFGIRWMPAFNVTNAEILSIDTEGGEISNSCIDKDTFIGTEWIYCIFRKSALAQDIAINIKLKNNLGSKVILLRNTQEVDNRTILEKCFAGDLNACNQVLNSPNMSTKMFEINHQKWESCKILSSPKERSECEANAASEKGQIFQQIELFNQLITQVINTYINCGNSENPDPSCKRKFAEINDGIYRYVNNVPTDYKFIYSFDFKY
jgi:hypothetical protein